jgi:hypothetical protein
VFTTFEEVSYRYQVIYPPTYITPVNDHSAYPLRINLVRYLLQSKPLVPLELAVRNSEHPSRMAGPSDTASNASNSTVRGLRNAQANNSTTDVTMTGMTPPTWKVKTKDPEEYYGDRAKLAGWINQLEKWFVFNPVPSHQKALAASTFLRGGAERWFRPFLAEYGKDDVSAESPIVSWPNFKRDISKIYGISNEKSTAERIIQNITQKTSTSEYVANFSQYAEVTDWDDDAKKAMFRKGLKKEVKDALVLYAGSTEELNDLMDAAIELDDKLYERRMEDKRGGKPFGRSGNFQKGPRFAKHTRGRWSAPAEYGEPMEIDTTMKKSPRKSYHKGTTKGDKKCFACGKPGHFARDCRSKNKVQQRQINMVDKTRGAGGPLSRKKYQNGRFNRRANEQLQEAIRTEEVPSQPEEPRLEAQRNEELPRYSTLDLSAAFTHTKLTQDPMKLRGGGRRSPDSDLEEYAQRLANGEISCDDQEGSIADWDSDGNPVGNLKPEEYRQRTETLERQKKQQNEHDSMSWTACYDNGCYVHMSDKQGSGWYPREHKRREPRRIRIIEEEDEKNILIAENRKLHERIHELRQYGTVPSQYHRMIENDRERIIELTMESTKWFDKTQQVNRQWLAALKVWASKDDFTKKMRERLSLLSLYNEIFEVLRARPDEPDMFQTRIEEMAKRLTEATFEAFAKDITVESGNEEDLAGRTDDESY